jgi:hypothetical protein
MKKVKKAKLHPYCVIQEFLWADEERFTHFCVLFQKLMLQ